MHDPPRTSADFALAWGYGHAGSSLSPRLRKVVPSDGPGLTVCWTQATSARQRARLRPREAGDGEDHANRRGARQELPVPAIGSGVR
jgi:hypothetical protein